MASRSPHNFLPYLEVANKAKEEGCVVERQTNRVFVQVTQKLRRMKKEKVKKSWYKNLIFFICEDVCVAMCEHICVQAG